MSGEIRKILGLTKGRLLKALKQIEEIEEYEIDSFLSNEENIKQLESVKKDYERGIARIQTETKIIEEKEKEWEELIKKLSKDEADEEAKLYEEKVTEKDSFEHIRVQAIGTKEVLEEQIVEINKSIESLGGHVERPKEAVVKMEKKEPPDDLEERIKELEKMVAERKGLVQEVVKIMAESKSFLDQSNGSAGSTGSSKQERAKVRMPEVTLPTFDGNPEDWPDFWGNFKSSVHDRDISTIDKFNYLKGALKGKAYNIVKSMPTDEDNYQEVLEILQERYGDTEGIKQSLQRKLRDLPPASGKVSDMRDTLEKIEVILRQLKVMGDDINNSTNVNIVKEKFSASVIEQLAMLNPKKKDWQLDELRKELALIIRMKENALHTSKQAFEKEQKSTYEKETKASKPGGQKTQTRSSAEAFTALTPGDKGNDGNSPPTRKIYPCAFCKGSHFNGQCDKYETIEKKRERARELELCMRCLRRGHFAQNCRNTRPCSYCEKNHNRAFCISEHQKPNKAPVPSDHVQKVWRRGPDNGNTSKTIDAHAVLEETSPEEEVIMKVTTTLPKDLHATQKQKEVIMLTAKTEVYNPGSDPDRKTGITAHIFFDSGSQRSFIAQSLANKLGLKQQTPEMLSVYTFGSSQPQQIKISLTHVEVMLQNGDKKLIEVSTVPMLTTKLQRITLRNEELDFIHQLPQKEVAEKLTLVQETVVPDLLIGADHFWDFIEMKEAQICPSGIYLIPSKVGLLIGGKREKTEENSDSSILTVLTSTVEEWERDQDSDNTKSSSKKIEDFWDLETMGIKDCPEKKDDEVTKGRDGEIRSAKVLPNKTMMNRPINLLYPLELSERNPQDSIPIDEKDKEETQKVTETEEENNEKQPRRSLRIANKRKFMNIFSTLTVFSIIFGYFLIGIQGAVCPDEEGLISIESQSCVKEGIVIMRTEEGNLCWKNQSCPTGHLQKDGVCGPKCACPEWAMDCSYYEGPPPATKGDPTAILNLAKPSICSFGPDARCHSKPTHTYLHMIQLYDGSMHYVKNFEFRRKQASLEEYECQGEGQQVGSLEFCAHHECAKTGTRFCYYRNHEIVYYVNEDGELPIKAWGTVAIAIYGPKQIPAESLICKECTLKCIPGGIEISMDEKIGLVEACVKPYCYQISHPKKNETILFPKQTIVSAHEVAVKIWSNGYLIKDFGKQCEATPYCEMINCYFCWNLIGNPQCAPQWIIFLVFTMLYFGSVTIYVLIKLIKCACQCCYYSSYFSWHCCRLVRILCRRAGTKTYEKMYLPAYTLINQENTEEEGEEQHEMRPLSLQKKLRLKKSSLRLPSRATTLTIAMTVILILSQAHLAKTCSEVTTLNAQQASCTIQYNGTMECIITEVTRIALVPQGQTSCLLIKDPNEQPIGTLSVEVGRIGFECQILSEYYTRSFEMRVASSKRCPDSGSCVETRCDNVKIDSLIWELGEEANNRTGFTYCVPKCGGWKCDCFYDFDGCLYYRTYAMPTSDITYEVFSCPVWVYKVKTTVRLNLQEENIEQVFDLKPGVPVSWNNLKLTLISVTSPMVPALASQFLTDGTRTALVKASASGQPVAGTIGELQCASSQKADAFDCYLPHDSCSCITHDERADCTCTSLNLEDIFTKVEHLLPIAMEGLSITGEGRKVDVEYSDMASLELQISLEGFKLYTKTEKNRCIITPFELVGCYGCLTGAKFKFNCQTDFGEALAHVKCGEAAFSTICNAEGISGITTMSFQRAQVKETCSVACPAGETTFAIEATLIYIEKEKLVNVSNAIAVSKEHHEVSLFKNGFDLDLGFLFNWITGDWKKVILTIMAVVVAMVLTVVFFPIIFQLLLIGVSRLYKGTIAHLFGLKNRRRDIKEL